MDADLELAINALDEIDDISQWELELTNLLAEFTLQAQFHMETLNSQLFKAENLKLLREQQTPLQRICIQKLKEYRCTILDQYEALQLKDLERARLDDEIRQIKEANMACHAKIEDLRSYLDEADATNGTLQSENASLRYKLIALEASISHIENKNEQLTKEAADEESKKYEAFIDHYQTNITNQNELIRKLQQELEGYNFLQKRYDHLEKENTHQKKEVTKLEETISALNTDYQSLVVEFTKANYHEKNAQQPEQCKAPVTSRNLDESYADSENKNTLQNSEFNFASNMIMKKLSPHTKTTSLMQEVIQSKAATPMGSFSNFEDKTEKPSKYQRAKNARLGSNGGSRQKISLSHSLKTSLNYIKDHEELFNNHGGSHSENELNRKGDASVKSGEIMISEFNSESDVDMERNRKQLVGTNLMLEQMTDRDDIFERENIMLSWDENDFPRLASRVSLRSERSNYRMNEFSAKKIAGSPQHLATRVFDNEDNKDSSNKKIGNTHANLELLSRKLEGLVTHENLQSTLAEIICEGQNNNHDEGLYTFRTPIKIEDQNEKKPRSSIKRTFAAQTFEKTTQTEMGLIVEETQSNFTRNRGSSAEKMCLSEIDQPTVASQTTSTCELKREAKRKYNFYEYHLMQSSLLSASTACTNKPLNTLSDNNTNSRTTIEEDNATKMKNMLFSAAEKVGPMIASASLTYLLLRNKVIS